MAKTTVNRHVRLDEDKYEELAKAASQRGISTHRLMRQVLEQTADDLANGGDLPTEVDRTALDIFKEFAVSGQDANITPELMLELERWFAAKLKFNIDYDKIEAERQRQMHRYDLPRRPDRQ
jgi:predicted DNA-binding ribbon-helix-helix protein